jgi:hypothetical protein
MCTVLDNFELRKWNIDVQVAQQQELLRNHTELHVVQDFSAIFLIDPRMIAQLSYFEAICAGLMMTAPPILVVHLAQITTKGFD